MNTQTQTLTEKQKYDYIIATERYTIKNFEIIDIKKQKAIGTTTKHGYTRFQVTINKVRCNLFAHRFIYYVLTGKIANVIDHIDHNKNNNNINNLRSVTQQQNLFNMNKVKGYYFNKNANKYMSYINKDNKMIYLGLFENEDDAKEAYLNAKQMYHNI